MCLFKTVTWPSTSSEGDWGVYTSSSATEKRKGFLLLLGRFFFFFSRALLILPIMDFWEFLLFYIHFFYLINFFFIPHITTLGQCGPGSSDNEEILRIPQSSGTTGATPSDCLMSLSGHSLGGVLPLCRDAVSVFYSPSRLGYYIEESDYLGWSIIEGNCLEDPW